MCVKNKTKTRISSAVIPEPSLSNEHLKIPYQNQQWYRICTNITIKLYGKGEVPVLLNAQLLICKDFLNNFSKKRMQYPNDYENIFFHNIYVYKDVCIGYWFFNELSFQIKYWKKLIKHISSRGDKDILFNFQGKELKIKFRIKKWNNQRT